MNKIKQELRSFYERQGVGRRRAEKLIKSDVASVMRQSNVMPLLVRTAPGRAKWVPLSGAFVWSVTKEGRTYWRDRAGWE